MMHWDGVFISFLHGEEFLFFIFYAHISRVNTNCIYCISRSQMHKSYLHIYKINPRRNECHNVKLRISPSISHITSLSCCLQGRYVIVKSGVPVCLCLGVYDKSYWLAGWLAG